MADMSLHELILDWIGRAGETVEEYVFDDERVAGVLKALGAGLLGQKVYVSGPDQEALYRLGKKVLQHIERLKADRTVQAAQQARITAVAKTRKLAQLQRMAPADFEYWVAGYFERRRFRDVVVTQLSGDYGIDVYMTCPNRAKAVVQCKRYSGAVGRPLVQQTYGAMKMVGAKRCYVVTTGRFTAQARAAEAKYKDIVLIDGQQLVSPA